MPLQIPATHPRGPQLRRIDRTLKLLPALVYKEITDLDVECWVTKEPVPYERRTTGDYKKLETGDAWGELWDCAWFHLTGTAPRDKSAVLLIDFSGEGLVVDEDGLPVQGLTTVSSGYDFSLGRPGKRVFPIGKVDKIDLWVEAGLNDLFGSFRGEGKLIEAKVALRNDEMQALCFDMEVLRELLNHIPQEKARHARILQALYDASLIATKDPEAARKILEPELERKNADSPLKVSAVGHAHIDLAWLWPIRETIRKGARTFSTVMRMMERYPDYVFGASQPQLFQWMKDHYPSLYKEIQKKVKEGRFELQGGFWVEPDCNVPSGESLVRQILYGTRFFRDEFGVEVDNIWEPDVFGYGGSLPQIIKKSGLDYFLTQKLSWSLYNVHPYHTFHWEGIDGSGVLVHMPPEATYNSSAAPRAIAKAEEAYQEKNVSENCLLLFGIGDGGGGPGEEHLERLEREKNLQGISPVKQEPASVFFRKLAKSADRYPTWRGELYLEFHQGTLTSQARNKRYNRKLEIALRELEFSAVQALRLAGQPYPSVAMDRIWKEVLLYQFHDILPGSSITRVYDESLARYAELTKEVAELTRAADSAWIAGPSLLNSLSWKRSEWVEVDGSWRYAQVPALAAVAVPLANEVSSPTATETLLENELLRVTFDAEGNLISVFDKENNREALRALGNDLVVYEDPGDAWDFAPDYGALAPDATELVSSIPSVDGPRAILTQTRTYGQSRITQQIVLTSGSRRLDFVTHVDWKETGKMLRTRFPVAVQSDTARCEIQFGNIARPTTQNTSWEAAKYEVCGHKWVDISERAYGVALLNDCKYGHNVQGNVLDLNLLRAPSYPDPVADRAEHEFTYSLFPHAGDYAEGGVIKAAYELNVPLRLTSGSGAEGLPFATIECENVVIETIKKAEDDDATIVRLYEAHGASATATVTFGFAVESVAITNLMEREGKEIDVKDNSVTIPISPFEILTLMVR